MKLKSSSQSGNVLFIILIAVALFGALSYTVANMMRGGDSTTITQDKAKLYAGEILDYASALRQAVQTVRINGCDDTDISFEDDDLTGYVHSPVASDECKIFNMNGGGAMTYITPPNNWQATISPVPALQGNWYFPANTCIPDIGSSGSGTGCGSDNADNEDLIAILPYIPQAICEQINDILSSSATAIAGTGDEWPSGGDKFTGSFTDDTVLNMDGRTAGCFEGDAANTPEGGTYHFFQVLTGR